MSLEENMEEILNIDVEHVEKPNLPKVKSKEDDQQKTMNILVENCIVL